MKNLFKMFGIIAIAVIIGFGMTACEVVIDTPASLGLNISGRTMDSITLSWTAQSNATSYSILRSFTSTGNYTILDTVYGTTYTDKDGYSSGSGRGLQEGARYYYRVIAYNGMSELISANVNGLTNTSTYSRTALTYNVWSGPHTLTAGSAWDFTANIYEPGNWAINWADTDNRQGFTSSQITADVIVSVRKGETPIALNVDLGTSNRITFQKTGTNNETIYIEVKGLYSSETGTFAVSFN